MWSKKLYNEVADIIERQRWVDEGNDVVQMALDDVVQDFANLFEEDNAAFDRARFVDACGDAEN